MSKHIMPTYGRLEITFERGQGAWLWDINNRRYLDALSGIAVCNLGHAHPAVHLALCKQSEKLIHTSNLYQIGNQQALADALFELTGMEQAFFCNSGAEANEAAIKLARLYGHRKGINDPVVIVMQNSFHGRTMGTLSATGNNKIKQGFEPLLTGFLHVPFNDVSSIEQAIHQQDNIVAILTEPVQGEGGVNIPDDDYLNDIRALCDHYDLLMMLDEIQTGIGRTGKFLASQHNNIKPDVCTLAKALGNGIPIGACLVNDKALNLLNAGQHGSTFGGNPLACSAALAVLDTMQKEDITNQAASKGNLIYDTLCKQLQSADKITNIRHKGMMFGIELDSPCADLVQKAANEHALLINVTADNTIRLLPPLIINKEQIALLTGELGSLLNNYTQNQ